MEYKVLFLNKNKYAKSMLFLGRVYAWRKHRDLVIYHNIRSNKNILNYFFKTKTK